MTVIFGPAPVGAGPHDDVHVSISEDAEGHDILNGDFSVSASIPTVWAVLTDYEGMADFVSSIKSSRIVKKEENFEVVEQVMSGKAGIFRKKIHLTLEVLETPPNKLSFRDTSKKSFKSYEGTWKVRDTEGQLSINYYLKAKPDFFSPDFLAKKAFKNTVKMLLTQVRDEIIARGSHQE